MSSTSTRASYLILPAQYEARPCLPDLALWLLVTRWTLLTTSWRDSSGFSVLMVQVAFEVGSFNKSFKFAR